MLTTALSHRDCNSALLSYTLMLPLEFHRAPSIHFYLAPTFLSSDDAQSLSFTWIFSPCFLTEFRFLPVCSVPHYLGKFYTSLVSCHPFFSLAPLRIMPVDRVAKPTAELCTLTWTWGASSLRCLISAVSLLTCDLPYGDVFPLWAGDSWGIKTELSYLATQKAPTMEFWG